MDTRMRSRRRRSPETVGLHIQDAEQGAQGKDRHEKREPEQAEETAEGDQHGRRRRSQDQVPEQSLRPILYLRPEAFAHGHAGEDKGCEKDQQPGAAHENADDQIAHTARPLTVGGVGVQPCSAAVPSGGSSRWSANFRGLHGSNSTMG
jgi:hypothetical protein